MNENIIVIVCGLCQKGRTPLVLRDETHYWELPNGRVRENESPQQAAIREFSAQTGITLPLASLDHSGKFKTLRSTFYFFHATELNFDSLRKQESGKERVRLFWYDRLLETDGFSHLHKICLRTFTNPSLVTT